MDLFTSKYGILCNFYLPLLFEHKQITNFAPDKFEN